MTSFSGSVGFRITVRELLIVFATVTTVMPDDVELPAVLRLLRRFGNWNCSRDLSCSPGMASLGEPALDESDGCSKWLSSIDSSSASSPGPCTGIAAA